MRHDRLEELLRVASRDGDSSLVGWVETPERLQLFPGPLNGIPPGLRISLAAWLPVSNPEDWCWVVEVNTAGLDILPVCKSSSLWGAQRHLALASESCNVCRVWWQLEEWFEVSREEARQLGLNWSAIRAPSAS